MSGREQGAQNNVDVMSGPRRNLAVKARVELVNLWRPQLLQQPITHRRLDVRIKQLFVTLKRPLPDALFTTSRRTGGQPFLDPLPDCFFRRIDVLAVASTR